MSRALAGLLLAFLLLPAAGTATLWAQVPDSADQPLDIDSLFEFDQPDDPAGDSPAPGSPDSTTSPPTGTLPPALQRVQDVDPVRLRGNFRFVLGYSTGLTQPLGEGGERQDLAVVELRSGLDLLFTVSPQLSISQRMRFEYPKYELKVTELAMDYAIEDAVFLTLGLKRINWSRSPNFPLTNIIHRRADKPLTAPRDYSTIIGRTVIPIGIGGLELLVQNKDEYQEPPGTTPQPDRMGYGAKFNYASRRLDLDVGGYYQSGLAARGFVSGSTTLTDRIELYGQGLVSEARLRRDDTRLRTDGKAETIRGRIIADNPLDFSLGAGTVVSFLSGALELNGEYLYHGEESENRVDGSTFPLYWGHNFAANVDYRIPDTPFRLRMGYRYNPSLDTGFFVPRVTVTPYRHLTLDLIGGMFFGAAGGYRAANPDDAKRPAFLTLAATVSGRI
ncbi:MAG: hypothetical protein EA403_02090 [Spirochaetaceae bacterium]|nr:MAG: hypothetical protein EA403_02090 [Spirochaetaceae bacterium]